MSAVSTHTPADASVLPPHELLFKRRVGLWSGITEMWSRRELVVTLAERDLRVRYKQTVLGFLWAVIVPLFLLLVFSVFLQRIVNFDTGNAPYAVFAYLGLIPWTFFSVSVNQGGQSIVLNSSLLNKVYCPREAFPISSVVVALFDASISTCVLGVLLLVTRTVPQPTTAYVPLLLVIQICFALGVALVVSALVVYIRDLRQAIPLLLQLGLFATPVAYPVPLSPEFYRLYAVLNPLAPVIDGYRRTILFGLAPDWQYVGLAALSSALWLVLGYRTFKRLETRFADVA